MGRSRVQVVSTSIPTVASAWPHPLSAVLVQNLEHFPLKKRQIVQKATRTLAESSLQVAHEI